MKRHLANAAYGAIDYAAYPIGMLLVAPLVLRHMGTASYGVWTIATAAVSMGSIIASGFGDANIQCVASQRGAGDHDKLVRAVRSMLGINLILGCMFSVISWLMIPYLVRHVAGDGGQLAEDSRGALRWAAGLIWVRTLETVCVSTQRAYERYGVAVQISMIARLLSLACAAGIAYAGRSVTEIVACTFLITLVGTALQFIQLNRLLGVRQVLPIFDMDATKTLLAFGVFTWLQAVSSLVFSQADRFLVGVSFGAEAVAGYALCVQMTQPVYGLAASGLHFLFPYLSRQHAAQDARAIRRATVLAFAANLMFVAATIAVLLLWGPILIRAWAGPIVADQVKTIFPVIAIGSGLLAMNVTATYGLFAFGRVRIVTYVNLVGGLAALGLMFVLLSRIGISGLAIARFVYGTATLVLYIPFLRMIHHKEADSQKQSALTPIGGNA